MLGAEHDDLIIANVKNRICLNYHFNKMSFFHFVHVLLVNIENACTYDLHKQVSYLDLE